jgi:hypothetical protein
MLADHSGMTFGRPSEDHASRVVLTFVRHSPVRSVTGAHRRQLGTRNRTYGWHRREASVRAVKGRSEGYFHEPMSASSLSPPCLPSAR